MSEITVADGCRNSGVNTAQMSVMKPYRVTLRTTVDVEIEVEAENENKAQGKALAWDGIGARDCATVGTYYWIDEDEEHCEDDDSEMYWEIVDAEFPEPVEVIELEDEGEPES